MKRIILIMALLAQFAYAHDDGHGPKLGDQPEHGGEVVAVIDKKEIEKGTQASLIYKGELTKNNQKVVRVYLYNKQMEPVKLKRFNKAYAEVFYKDRETRKWKKKKFELKKDDNSFKGEIPGNPRRPFNIDVTVKEGDKTLFMAFDNLH